MLSTAEEIVTSTIETTTDVDDIDIVDIDIVDDAEVLTGDLAVIYLGTKMRN